MAISYVDDFFAHSNLIILKVISFAIDYFHQIA